MGTPKDLSHNKHVPSPTMAFSHSHARFPRETVTISAPIYPSRSSPMQTHCLGKSKSPFTLPFPLFPCLSLPSAYNLSRIEFPVLLGIYQPGVFSGDQQHPRKRYSVGSALSASFSFLSRVLCLPLTCKREKEKKRIVRGVGV